MSFFGCVFNEYIVLYCCNLELETQDEIADRAKIGESEKLINQSELKSINDNESGETTQNDYITKNTKTILSINSSYNIKI